MGKSCLYVSKHVIFVLIKFGVSKPIQKLIIICDIVLLWHKKRCQFWFVYVFYTLFYVLFTISLIKNMLCLQIDYISRLMWQAQLRGHKTWRLVPPPDCDHICTGFSFRVEPGDIGKLLLNREVMTFHISSFSVVK